VRTRISPSAQANQKRRPVVAGRRFLVVAIIRSRKPLPPTSVILSHAPAIVWTVAIRPGAWRRTYAFRPYMPLPFVGDEEITGTQVLHPNRLTEQSK
jgi:hypothetical protein